MWGELFDCLWTNFKKDFPNLGWWLLSVLIACIVTGVVGGVLSGGTAIPVILAGCGVVAGISIVGATLIAMARAVWDCS